MIEAENFGPGTAVIARTTLSRAHVVGAGICSVCGMMVPLERHLRGRVGSHWPDDPADAYDANPSYYCRGSNDDPAQVLGPLPATVFTTWWDDDVPYAEILRLSRSWAIKLSERQTVSMVRMQTFATVGA